ncbi:MAG: multicomponent Na+:H+ antiporter subunit C [Candidatus Argoarchaeum ethanivorans]|uniref:Multicomponent Na+:H+ antiporter subunit C n=1 Tax=Candidatus Argoarchaeum ethanivorans TaxID=2608793 RepID=A0A8B3S2Q5_9EURY|nr:MAG: multicomponent Na+:H+ antiporter subunit C [Candidatus Argoarchaeum ethanivorans]
MEWIAEILGKYNYWTFIIIMLIGFYGMIAKDNLIKKIIGLSIFQTAIFLFYVSLADVIGGTEPIVIEGYKGLYVNPLPHVLILTAIVVSVATLAVALALVIRIHEEYGTIEEREILIKEREAAS